MQSDLRFLGKCWKLAGRPTFCMLIREENIRYVINTKYLFDMEYEGQMPNVSLTFI